MAITRLPSGRYRVQIRKKFCQLDAIFDTEQEAQAAQDEALSKASPQDKALDLATLWERYTASSSFEDKSAHTQRTERQRIKPVLSRFGRFTLAELEANQGIIYDYIDERRRTVSPRTKRKLSGTQVRLEIAALSAVVAYAKDRRLIHHNFVAHVSRPAQTRRSRRVNNEEQGALALHARHNDPATARAARFMMLVRHLGCRPGELCELLISDVHLDRHEVIFKDTKNKTDRAAHTTKDARELLHLQLAEVPEGCPFLFHSISRKGAFVPYHYSGGSRKLKKLGVVLDGFHPHAGRREFVSRGVEAGVPLSTIKKQTGHKSVQALEIYDNGLSTAPEIRAALDALADTVNLENLMGALSAAGMTPEQRQSFLARIGKGGEVSFEQASQAKARR